MKILKKYEEQTNNNTVYISITFDNEYFEKNNIRKTIDLTFIYAPTGNCQFHSVYNFENFYNNINKDINIFYNVFKIIFNNTTMISKNMILLDVQQSLKIHRFLIKNYSKDSIVLHKEYTSTNNSKMELILFKFKEISIVERKKTVKEYEKIIDLIKKRLENKKRSNLASKINNLKNLNVYQKNKFIKANKLIELVNKNDFNFFLLGRFIDMSFTWDDTEEGYTFWKDIKRELQSIDSNE